MEHRLLNQLTASNCTDEEIKELYEDLQFIYDNPFDKIVNDAIRRGCAYVEVLQQQAN